MVKPTDSAAEGESASRGICKGPPKPQVREVRIFFFKSGARADKAE